MAGLEDLRTAAARVLELDREATAGPWAWIEKAANERRARDRGKPRSKLTKADGAWVHLLAGPIESARELTHEDAFAQGYDEWNCARVFGLAWSSVKGDTISNATPAPPDRDLITEYRTAAPTLARAVLALLDAVDEAWITYDVRLKMLSRAAALLEERRG